jgi:hypothetical protein
MTQASWEPALKALVSSIGAKFSAAFDRMTVSLECLRLFCLLLMGTSLGIGCAGEIQIAPHEDYAQWAIDILVKFRDNEKLQLLTGQRQSGGVCVR